MTVHNRRPVSFHEQRLNLVNVELDDLFRQQAHLTSRIMTVGRDRDGLKRGIEIAKKRGYKSFDLDAILNNDKETK